MVIESYQVLALGVQEYPLGEVELFPSFSHLRKKLPLLNEHVMRFRFPL